MTGKNQFKDIFTQADISSFREKQMADLEQRTQKTMINHVSMYGHAGAPTVRSELTDTVKTIEEFATKQVDKMKRMGISNDEIRTAVLGSIQSASLGISPKSYVKEIFNNLIEEVNNNIDNHIHHRMARPSHNSLSLSH